MKCKNFIIYVLIVLFILIYMFVDTPKHDNKALLYHGNTSSVVEYNKPIELEMYMEAVDIVNKTIRKYTNDQDELNAYVIDVDFVDSLIMMQRDSYGCAYDIVDETRRARLTLLKYNAFKKDFQFFYGIHFNGSYKRACEFKKYFYRAVIVHELTHVYFMLKGLETDNIAYHEYFAYAIGFSSIPKEFIDYFINRAEEITDGDIRFPSQSYINYMTYYDYTELFAISSYLHFKENDGKLFKYFYKKINE